MPAVAPLLDLTTVNFAAPLADREAIRRVLPHRFAMEQLTAVVHLDPERHLVVGYRDVAADEFWVRGHFPGHPLLPGVLIVEAAAQLTCFYTLRQNPGQGVLFGLGGIDNARFRRGVVPGERLVLVAKGLRVKPRVTNFHVQGFVGDELAFHADVLGVVLGMSPPE